MDDTTNLKVLIVDDEAMIVDELSEYVESLGFEVISTITPVDVCDMLIDDPSISIVISDLKMPKLDGFSLIERIKNTVPNTHKLSIIIISGNYNIEDALQAVHLGVSDFLTKPLSIDLLHHALKRIVESLHLRKLEKDLIAQLKDSLQAANIAKNIANKANTALVFQNVEKEKRAAELVIANEEKAKRADELALANKALAFQKELEGYRSDMERVAQDLTRLIDTANAPIFGIDVQGNVNQWNKKSAEITGFTAEEVMGENLVNNFIRADYQESVNNVLQKALNSDETASYELPLYTKKNERVMVLLNATTRRNVKGEVIGVVGVGQNITEQVSYRDDIETKIKARTRELNTILTLSPDGFVLVNADNNIAYINPAFLAMTGFKEATFIGNGAQIFIEAMTGLFDLDHIEHMEGIGSIDGEQLLYLVRPTVCILHCNMRTMVGLTGGKEGQVFYFKDVTHEAEVDKMKSEFLSTAAHELRTPLASIYGFSELLMDRDYDKETSHEMIKIIHRQSFNLKKLLDELLDLSRIEARAGKDFYMDNHSLENVVQQSCVEAEGVVKGRIVDVQLLGTWPLVSVDINKIHQVLNNLLSNGFKYSPENKKVTLKTSERVKNGSRQFGMSIIDQGIGMTEAQISRLGERFYRADDSGSTPGTGLGVALVKEIVSIHSGEIEFVSTMGNGMNVTVWLPVVKNQPSEILPYTFVAS